MDYELIEVRYKYTITIVSGW